MDDRLLIELNMIHVMLSDRSNEMGAVDREILSSVKVPVLMKHLLPSLVFLGDGEVDMVPESVTNSLLRAHGGYLLGRDRSVYRRLTGLIRRDILYSIRHSFSRELMSRIRGIEYDSMIGDSIVVARVYYAGRTNNITDRCG